jgi:peptidoglycan/LPS O-acetylase OafA/YrhL
VFAVDVFFFIAGLLLTHVFLRDSSKLLAKYPLAIFQRMLRIWPSYIFTILIYYSVYDHLGSGPLWGQDEIYTSVCGRMWKPIFFVDNLVDNGEKQCMNWGWYLQNDMQLFIFSIILLYVYRLKPIIMKVIVWPLMLGSMVFSFMWTFDHNTILITHISDAQQQGNYFADVYSKPWARCSPYLIGLFFGILHF